MEKEQIRETVTQNPKLDFTPTTPEEENHLKRLKELLSLKRRGDWVLISEMCGITSKNAELAFTRVYSKHHLDVVNALEKVIESRKQFLTK